MSISAETLAQWGEIPYGTQCPKPGTPVLLNRNLRPGTDMSALSRFRDDCWDLNPAVFEDHASSLTLNFGLVSADLRLATKFYIWQLINHSSSETLGRIGARMSITTIHHEFTTGMQFVLDWFAKQGITEFCQITPALLERYLDAVIAEDLPLTHGYRRLREVRRLWAHREILPTRLRLPDAPPWDGEDTHGLLGATRRDHVNRTPRIGEPTMQTLLHWAIRFVENLAEDIIAAHDEYLELRSRTPHQRCRSGRQGRKGQHRHKRNQLKQTIAAYLQDLRDRGEPLPGRRGEDGQVQIHWSRLATILDYGSPNLEGTPLGRMITESSLPIGEHVYLSSPVTGLLDGQPWRPHRIHYEEAAALARLLSTACFIIVAYLSGARVGEVLNLRRGCIAHDQATGLWLMTGLYFKSAEDEDGNKIPEGQIRPDPWVVIDLVATAVAVLERLHPSELLFPTMLEPRNKRRGDVKRLGEARGTTSITKDLEDFRAWVNTYCQRHKRADHIPDDGHGALTPSRFRRTLAWFIRRRPRGLIAASIQYGHTYTRMLQGYAGSYESGFPTNTPLKTGCFASRAWLQTRKPLPRGNTSAAPPPTPTVTG
jgi:integrase